jgi:regulatory protein YycI of two-component signal transduction system YycFG
MLLFMVIAINNVVVPMYFKKKTASMANKVRKENWEGKFERDYLLAHILRNHFSTHELETRAANEAKKKGRSQRLQNRKKNNLYDGDVEIFDPEDSIVYTVYPPEAEAMVC